MTNLMEGSSAIPDAVTAMWTVNSDSIDSAMKVWSQWIDDWTKVQQESLEFLRDRMSRDMAAATHIATCKSPTEVFDLQFRHTCEAVAEYVAETQKLVSLLNRAAAGSFATARSGAHTASDE